MKKFASNLNHPAYERHILHLLETELGAIDVTGLSAWERAQKVYRGLVEPEARNRVPDGPSKVKETRVVSGSASPVVQDPLFPDEEQAA